MSVQAYHPETRATLTVTEGQLAHMRASGWLLLSEYQANQAAEKAAAEKAPKGAKSTDEGK